MHQLAIAQLCLERARAQFAREARGCTIDEVEGGRHAAARALRETNIPLNVVATLDNQQLELLVDTFLEHERGKR